MEASHPIDNKRKTRKIKTHKKLLLSSNDYLEQIIKIESLKERRIAKRVLLYFSFAFITIPLLILLISYIFGLGLSLVNVGISLPLLLGILTMLLFIIWPIADKIADWLGLERPDLETAASILMCIVGLTSFLFAILT